jgi:ABC-type siderophore export system fused ATPase/permease subunit
MALLQHLNQGGTTIVMVTHSEVWARYAGRVLRLSDGRLVETDPDDGISAALPDNDDALRISAGIPV